MYDETRMFECSGDIYSYLDTETSVEPYSIDSFLSDDSSAGTINGDIDGSMSSSRVYIDDGVTGDEWKLWKFSCGGDFTVKPSDAWHATVVGEDPYLLIGKMVGDKFSDNELSGKIVGLTVDLENIGIFEGRFLGTYSDESGAEFWQAVGGGVWLDADYYADLKDAGAAISEIDNEITVDSIQENNTGLGDFMDAGGAIQLDNFSGITLNFNGQKEGIWVANGGGEYGEITAPLGDSFGWHVGTGGNFMSGGSWVGAMSGTGNDFGELTGDFKGVWFADIEGSPYLRGGSLTAEVRGEYVDIPEEPGNGTWNVASAGEWVEVGDLFDPESLGFDMTDMNNFVNVPITEAYSNTLNTITSPNSFMTSITMDVSLYQNSVNNIWAALISGGYNPAATVPATWTLGIGDGGSDSVQFSNGTWNGGSWTADVAGTLDGNSITGQAGGTYADGSFSGVGAGTWTPPTT